MSGGRSKVPWSVAADLAKRLSGELSLHVTRVKTAGSIRRRESMVGDIELVVEPYLVGDLVGSPTPRIESVRGVVEQWGRFTKEGPRYMQVIHREGIQVDLFLAHPPAQWGSILAIRTGPADVGRLIMQQLRRRNLAHRDGGVFDEAGRPIPVPDEQTLFALAGLPFVPAARRRDLVGDR